MLSVSLVEVEIQYIVSGGILKVSQIFEAKTINGSKAKTINFVFDRVET